MFEFGFLRYYAYQQLSCHFFKNSIGNIKKELVLVKDVAQWFVRIVSLETDQELILKETKI